MFEMTDAFLESFIHAGLLDENPPDLTGRQLAEIASTSLTEWRLVRGFDIQERVNDVQATDIMLPIAKELHILRTRGWLTAKLESVIFPAEFMWFDVLRLLRAITLVLRDNLLPFSTVEAIVIDNPRNYYWGFSEAARLLSENNMYNSQNVEWLLRYGDRQICNIVRAWIKLEEHGYSGAGWRLVMLLDDDLTSSIASRPFISEHKLSEYLYKYYPKFIDIFNRYGIEDYQFFQCYVSMSEVSRFTMWKSFCNYFHNNPDPSLAFYRMTCHSIFLLEHKVGAVAAPAVINCLNDISAAGLNTLLMSVLDDPSAQLQYLPSVYYYLSKLTNADGAFISNAMNVLLTYNYELVDFHDTLQGLAECGELTRKDQAEELLAAMSGARASTRESVKTSLNALRFTGNWGAVPCLGEVSTIVNHIAEFMP